MKIKHVSVVMEAANAQDSDTQDIIELLEALPICDLTSITVTDNVQGAITGLAATLSTTEETLLKESARKRLSH